MQKLTSKRAQLIGSVVSIIIWIILTISVLYELFTNQYSTAAGKVTGSVLVVLGIFFLVSNVRSYLKLKGKKEF